MYCQEQQGSRLGFLSLPYHCMSIHMCCMRHGGFAKFLTIQQMCVLRQCFNQQLLGYQHDITTPCHKQRTTCTAVSIKASRAGLIALFLILLMRGCATLPAAPYIPLSVR